MSTFSNSTNISFMVTIFCVYLQMKYTYNIDTYRLHSLCCDICTTSQQTYCVPSGGEYHSTKEQVHISQFNNSSVQLILCAWAFLLSFIKKDQNLIICLFFFFSFL